MKNIRNIISCQTRLDAILECGIEYGTERWHKRCTGYTTATAMKVLAHAMQRQGKAVDMSSQTDTPCVDEALRVYEVCRKIVHQLQFVGFTFNKADLTVICNVFEPVE